MEISNNCYADTTAALQAAGYKSSDIEETHKFRAALQSIPASIKDRFMMLHGFSFEYSKTHILFDMIYNERVEKSVK